ncbi:MAG: hypothetical protein NC483_06325 [Ruminococcus sp.]|nr:hypothetical protein [Ruminococcus sp.]
MKKNIFNFLFCFFWIIALIFIFNHNKEVATVILNGISLFFKKVFVSLFPMFIINDMLISINLPYYFYKTFNKIFKKIFKTSGICAYVFVMSLISGTPSNAYILKSLVENNQITAEEANHFLYFTYFSNPLFLTIMLSQIFDPLTTLKIIIAHYTANIIIAFIKRNKAPLISNKNINKNSSNISSALIKSINKSINTLLMILGTIIFYMLITYIITNLFDLPYIFKTIIAGFLEITNGLNYLTNLKIIAKLKEIIAVSIISFGGLSINTQIKSILEDTDINYSYFLKGRLMQVIISIIIIILI